MAIGHLAIRTHSRKHAHTAAAALAYRHGVRLECSRSGEVHDYRRRARHDDIAGDGIVSARPSPLGEDLDTLARAIEAAERRGDARLLRDVQLGLPARARPRGAPRGHRGVRPVSRGALRHGVRLGGGTAQIGAATRATTTPTWCCPPGRSAPTGSSSARSFASSTCRRSPRPRCRPSAQSGSGSPMWRSWRPARRRGWTPGGHRPVWRPSPRSARPAPRSSATPGPRRRRGPRWRSSCTWSHLSPERRSPRPTPPSPGAARRCARGSRRRPGATAERLLSRDPDPVIEDLTVAVEPAAAAARFAEAQPVERPLCALCHPAVVAPGAARRFEELRVVSARPLPLRPARPRAREYAGARPGAATDPSRACPLAFALPAAAGSAGAFRGPLGGARRSAFTLLTSHRRRTREEAGALAGGATGTPRPCPVARARCPGAGDGGGFPRAPRGAS